MIPLDFDHPVFQGTSDTAFLLQGLGQGLQFRATQGNSLDDCYRFSAPPFGFTMEPDYPVADSGWPVAAADAGGDRTLALGAKPACIRAVYQPATTVFALAHRMIVSLCPGGQYISLPLRLKQGLPW